MWNWQAGVARAGISVTLLSCAAAAMGQTAAAENWVAVAEQVAPSVVVIRSDKGQGSGFLVDADGTIVTNEHVVNGVTELTVTLDSGEVFSTVWIVSTDAARDLAILRIAGTHLPALPLADSNAVRVGEPVALLGAPRGLGATLSTGIVSAVRIVGGSRTIQTTAAASTGSSGSPLVNQRGEAIGVLTWARVDGNDLNFSVPINYVKGMLATELLAGGARRLVADRLLADTRMPADSVFVGATFAGQGLGFLDMVRNLLDSLFDIGVHVANTEQIAAQSFDEWVALNGQVSVARAAELGTAWVLHLTSDIEQDPSTDNSTVLECLSVPSGERMWTASAQAGVSTAAVLMWSFNHGFTGGLAGPPPTMSPRHAVNDLSRDLTRELRKRIGQPCVIVNGQRAASRPALPAGDSATVEVCADPMPPAYGGAHCTLPRGHEGVHEGPVGESDTVRWGLRRSPQPASPAGDSAAVEVCGERARPPYTGAHCTLPRGHEGIHEAPVGQSNTVRWGDHYAWPVAFDGHSPQPASPAGDSATVGMCGEWAPPPYSGAHCTLPRGHEGVHETPVGRSETARWGARSPRSPQPASPAGDSAAVGMCGERAPPPYTGAHCTLPRGHEGVHETPVGRSETARWGAR